jgi:transcriptional regulator GlxA family with amidase domain
MAKVLIPLYHGFNMLDVCGPAEMFGWADGMGSWSIDLVAEVPGAVSSINGFSLNVADGLPGPTEQYDAMWVPGGDPQQLDRIIHDPNRTYLNFIAAQAAQARWVCSVCEGALLAAAAGLLDGYSATTHWAFYPYLQKYFPKVMVVPNYPRFVVDRNRLTGGGISSGLDESLKLIELISGTAAAMDVQQSTQYYPNPPVTGAIPADVPMPDMPTPP